MFYMTNATNKYIWYSILVGEGRGKRNELNEGNMLLINFG